jgi:hypothetical protein
MKSLASGIQAAVGLITVALITTCVYWSTALAQGAPGGTVRSVPEPSSLALMATAIAVVAAVKKFRSRR